MASSMPLPQAFGLSFVQSEVDFVIPDLATDRPLCIDPFLLYKSKDPSFRALHDRIVSVFNRGIQFFADGERQELDRIIDFPEVNEIGLGYSSGRVQGSGLGAHLNRLVADMLAGNQPLQERGLRHIEELQILSPGVGPDRVSDVAANILKSYLVYYTRQQAELWNIPITAGLPLSHCFDFDTWEWCDRYYDLPRNPVSGDPILLVPRRIVRRLPWINYEDYAATDFKLFLRPARSRPMPKDRGKSTEQPLSARKMLAKAEVVSLTRQHLNLLDEYVLRKEREAINAEPSDLVDQRSAEVDCLLGDNFVSRLDAIPSGHTAARDYQRAVFEILNFLFEPELTAGEMEVGTYLGTERRDIVYFNEADKSFWGYVRGTYGSPLVMFEVKNVGALEFEHVNQTATYLGARLGMLGFIVTRRPPGENVIRKTYTVFNDTPSMPRKVVLILSDKDLVAMIRQKQAGKSAVPYIQGIYRQFRQRLQ